MTSLSVFRQRTVVKPILLFLWVFIFAAAAIIPARTENASAMNSSNWGMFKGYCSSTLDQPIVYFSNIFDANLKAQTKISTLPLSSAFKIYLVEQYDFKSSSNYPAGCSLFQNLSQAEASKRQLAAQAQQAGKQIVEVNWNPGPLSEVTYGDMVAVGPAKPPPTHTFCAVANQSTMYFSAVFDTQGALPNPKWNDGFNEFLNKQYSFRPEVDATCTTMNTTREAEAVLNARVGGVRYNKHKAVETGWKFDPTGTYKPVPKPTPKSDDDPEPQVSQKPRPAPPADIRSFATKEAPLVMEYCQKDPMLSKVFDCFRVQRSVYNYRMEHGGSEPLASLFTQEKVNLAGAINNASVSIWVKQRTTAQGISNKVSNCIEQKFIVSFYEKSYISQMQKIYNTSVAACK